MSCVSVERVDTCHVHTSSTPRQVRANGCGCVKVLQLFQDTVTPGDNENDLLCIMFAYDAACVFAILFSFDSVCPASQYPRNDALSFSPDPIGSVQGVISRIIGAQHVNSFGFDVIPPDNGMDTFELGSPSAAQRTGVLTL